MSVRKTEELLANELSCPICLKLFSEPVMLPCGHNYCLACIWEAMMSEKGPHLCPECRQEFPGSKALQRNLKLCNIVDTYRAALEKSSRDQVWCGHCLEDRTPAAKTCLSCEISLCSHHLQRHSIKYSFSNHTLMEPMSDLSGQKCSIHSKALEFFCVTDASVLCASCFIEGTHQDHDIQNFESAEADIRCILQSQVKLASNKMKMVETLLQRSLEDEKVFATARNRLVAKSMTLLGSMLQRVNSYKSGLSRELEEEQGGQQESWQAGINHVMKQQAGLKEVHDQVASILEETDTSMFVLRYLGIKDRLKDAIESNVSMPSQRVLDVKRLHAAMETDEFREEMTRLLQALHTLLNPLELTFDPNTVHPNLILSNDLKTVKYSAKRQTYPEHAERFQTTPQVLCAQGFSGGEHVWVVELGPGAWSVGLCYHSMPRKGDVSRLGHNAVSWRLQWKNKKLTACHGSSVAALPDTLPPLRLEMILDYGAGTLSFHSTVGRREHLHTFRTTFRETVYPAFSIHSTSTESWITLQN
ncbi:E3 ubiquitin/ISG15 ligase TRIM25 [Scleropages formosus]|uniref:E3 ubiquitin/ISG15 ligase TRIM25 n=1 Tax=Scleropages formosus TaxID=113540 RepID=UPI0006378393|nr:E3 ubiquitin/ISG15 ligase TRIM25-like [Scleropages formosus]